MKNFKDYKIIYLEEKKPLGTAGCLSLLNYKKTKENILVFNGDVITDLNIVNSSKFYEKVIKDIKTNTISGHKSGLYYFNLGFS